MSRVCQITGKKPSTGNNVSHSNRHTKRRYLPNLQKRDVFNPVTGKVERMTISTKGLRTLMKASRKKKKSSSK